MILGIGADVVLAACGAHLPERSRELCALVVLEAQGP